MYKCECGFECASERLFLMHKERENAGITQRQEKQIINEHREEYLKSEDKISVLKKYSGN